MSVFKFFGAPVIDEHTPFLAPHELAILLHMEQSILFEKRKDELIKECAERLLSGAHDWTKPIQNMGHDLGRQVEHGAIAEAIKTLKETKE